MMWKADVEIRKWKLLRPCVVFQKKYDAIQQQIYKLSCGDDLLSG